MRRLLLAILALIAIVSAPAIAFAQDDAEPVGEGIRGRTLTCSASLELTLACFVEQTAFAVGPFEVAIGVDTRLAFAGRTPSDAMDALAATSVEDRLNMGGYLLLGWYESGWGIWTELHLPQLTPVFGNPDWLRVGFTVRF